MEIIEPGKDGDALQDKIDECIRAVNAIALRLLDVEERLKTLEER